MKKANKKRCSSCLWWYGDRRQRNSWCIPVPKQIVTKPDGSEFDVLENLNYYFERPQVHRNGICNKWTENKGT